MNPLRRTPPSCLSRAVALACAATASMASAQTLNEVVVSASREAQTTFDAPAAIQAVGREAIEAAGPQVNLSESLNRVPGITALNRQNYAQDLQLSIRGQGSRSPFGIRGVRLVVDGIPASMPDGQGQASTVSLSSAQRIEVLRGPLAQLHGNAAGGVVQVFTADGPATPEAGASLTVGSDGLQRLGLFAAGQSGRLNYVMDASGFDTDGYRDHSAAQRRHFNGKWRFDATPDTRVTLVANLFGQPSSEDPQGLTRAQWEANPRQADNRTRDHQTGKSVSQNQVGLVVEHRLDKQRSLTAKVYAGERELFNRLSIPLSAQNAPTAAGGIVRLDRRFSGLGLQYTHQVPLGEGRLDTTVGLDHERMTERRQGYINNLGVQGALKRDEDDTVRSTGAYAQARWWLNADWSLLAGLRSNRVRFGVADRFITATNPDDSGRASFSGVNPVLGVTRHLSETTNLYANVGRGLETPTFTELAYRAGGSGPNLQLRAARSVHAELGLKTQLAPGHRLDVAAFHIATDDELVVASSSGGRTLYTNAAATRRSGVELAYSGQLTPEWRAHLALSALNARFAEGFGTGSSAVAAGNRIPGTVARTVFAELAWQPQAWPGLTGAVEAVHQSGMWVDDVNSDRTPAYTVLNLRMGLEQRLGAWRLREFVRLDNVGNTRYVGSVIANESNRRFFESAPGRTWMLGVVLSRSLGG